MNSLHPCPYLERISTSLFNWSKEPRKKAISGFPKLERGVEVRERSSKVQE